MSTVCPWPGVTDWAVENSAFSSKKSVPSDRHPGGQVEALVGEDVAADEQREDDHHDHGDELAQVLLDRESHLPTLSGGPAAGRGPVEVRLRVLVAVAARLVRRLARRALRARAQRRDERVAVQDVAVLRAVRPACRSGSGCRRRRSRCACRSRCRRSPARRSRTPTIVYQNSLYTEAPVVLAPSWMHRVAGGQDHLVEAAAREVGLLEQVERVVHDRARRLCDRRLQVAEQPAQLGLGEQLLWPARSTA